MYAIFEDGSRQYRVSVGEVVKVDYRGGDDGEGVPKGTAVEFPRILLHHDGTAPTIGQPVVAGARILGEVVDHPSIKVYIQKFRKRKNYRRLRGHRQWYTAVKVKHILLAGQEPTQPAPAPAPEQPPASRRSDAVDWLFEGLASVYLLLGIGGVTLFALWWRDRKAHWLAGMGAVALLAMTYFVLDRVVETRREQIARKLHEMADALGRKDIKGIAAHLSPQFRYNSAGKDRFIAAGEKFINQGWVDTVAIWDIRVGDGPETLLFAKPRSGPAAESHYLVRTQWVEDPDGQWRMTGFTVHNPFVDTQTPLPVPSLPN